MRATARKRSAIPSRWRNKQGVKVQHAAELLQQGFHIPEPYKERAPAAGLLFF